MWQLIVNSPDQEPKIFQLKPGKLNIGRSSTNAIIVNDSAASRQHAEISFDSASNKVILTDLNSTNGTYINRQRVNGAYQLNTDDVIRIGQVVMHLTYDAGPNNHRPAITGTHRFTRELVLESLDEQSVPLFEISKKLNTVLDLDTAIKEVTQLMKRSMGVDYCEVILHRELKLLETSDLVDPLAKKALHSRAAEVTATTMFVPIMSGENVLGLISMHKSRPEVRPFSRRDLQLAVAISHQAALTIQRMELLEKVRAEEQTRRLLLRFVAPTEAEYMLKDYLTTGELPALKEQKITVMFSDIADSTGLAERLGTKHFATILNNFYQEAAAIVFRNKGMIKYLGDGILGIFPEHQDEVSSENKAVMAGRELINVLNRTGSLDPDRRLIIGVAINTGNAMVGYIGTKERAEFNVMGDVVNVAYRMQDYARPYKIIVGPATVAAISHKYTFRRVGAVVLRGREQSIQAYEVLP